jgi:hypothetical protein
MGDEGGIKPGETHGELRQLYLAKTLERFKMQYYDGLSAVMGLNAREVVLRYQNEDEGINAIKHEINAAQDVPAESPR